jgi:hypothetical protein
MIRLGPYDAYDKWEIVCRYWADRAAPPDPGLDKLKRPRLPRWDHIAASRGTAACLDYLRIKTRSLEAAGAADNPVDGGEAVINREVAALAREIGHQEIQRRVIRLAEAIPANGFLAPFEEGLPARLVDRMREVFKAGALHALRWTEDVDELPTLEILREQAPPYPVDAISGCRNVLSLFSAWFYGRSDVIRIHDSCPEHVTLVDINEPLLQDMQLIYPAHWTYVRADYRDFLRQAEAEGRSYDLIVCDPFTDLVKPVAWDFLPIIMQLCSGTFITNYFAEMFSELGMEHDDLDGLSRAVKQRTGVDVAFVQALVRNSAVSWMVMRKK